MWKPQSVPNDQSTARDHLANERTFLAWVRTGLAVVGFGFLLLKADAHGPGPQHLGTTWLAGLLWLLGVMLIAYGSVRYEQNRRALQGGRFLIAHWGVWVLSLVALLFVLGLGAALGLH